MYLIFDNLADAELRADQEGQYRDYSFWKYGVGTKWVTAPVETAEGDFALDVSGYELDDVEETLVVETITLPSPPEEEEII